MFGRKSYFRKTKKAVKKRYSKSVVSKASIARTVKKIIDPSINTKTYHFKRRAFLSNITSGILAIGQGQVFKLSDIPDLADFTGLYDEYMITSIKLEFISSSIPTERPTWLMTLIDEDDVAVPANYDILNQNPKTRIRATGPSFTITFKPKTQGALYNNGITTAYGARYSFIDLAYTGVEHYGLKMFIGPTAVAGTSTYNIFAVYSLAFRGVR